MVEVRMRGRVSDLPQVNELAKVVRNEVGWNRTVADLPKLENFSLISILGILISEIEELNNFSVNQMFVIVFLRHLTGCNFFGIDLLKHVVGDKWFSKAHLQYLECRGLQPSLHVLFQRQISIFHVFFLLF